MSVPPPAAVIRILSDSDDDSTSKPASKRVRTEETEEGKLIFCLDDSSSDEEQEEPYTAVAPAAVGVPAVAALDTRLTTVSSADNIDGEQVLEIETVAAASQIQPVAPTVSTSDNEDEADTEEEDVAIVGQTGHFALVDFPHARENCVTHPMAEDPLQRCANCYCYVCDRLASTCPLWLEHCHATHTQARWKNLREEYKQNGVKTPPPAAAASMNVNPTRTAGTQVRGRKAQDDDDFSTRALLEAVVSVYPVEMSPPSTVFQSTLRHYQQQSLAFMVDVERQPEAQMQTRGGFCCDDVGMGKSAVVLALVATNPMPTSSQPSRQQIESFHKLTNPGYQKMKARLKVKATVILTSVSLMGQWEDECKKHAPGLRFMTFHSSRRVSYLHPKCLGGMDVIISASTFPWEDYIVDNFEFFRVVVDESHLFTTAPSSAKIKNAIRIHSKQKWCVTATPSSTSISSLARQLSFLNSNKDFGRFASLQRAMSVFASSHSFGSLDGKRQTFTELVDELKKIMIRHTKGQRIAGSEALALPPSTTSTVFFDMSDFERQLFDQSYISRSAMQRYERHGSKLFPLERALLFRMKSAFVANPQLSLTKVNALVEDLRELRQVEPNFRVVIFTQYKDAHGKCVDALRREGMSVFQFDGSTNAKCRDTAIRSFQSQTDERPAAFVITIRAGNVGITLTAASRVYLMEPCIDPSVEWQSAGRIHRLGQTKPVHVKKFVFNNSVESNIVELHEEVRAGRISIVNQFIPGEGVQILAKGIRSRI